MIENEAVNVTAYVRIYKDPTGVLWHNFTKYSSFIPTTSAMADMLEAITQKNRPGWLV